MLESLRRFGLGYCDLPTMIDNVTFLLQMLTVNINRNCTERSLPIIISCVITILAGTSYLYVYVISMAWFVLVRCRETKDFVAAAVIYSLAACSLAGVAKLIYMRLQIDTVKNIVEEYLACDASVVEGSRFSHNLLKGLKIVKRRAIIIWLFLIINGVIYVVVSMILPGRHLPEDLYVLYGLEPMFESPNYEIAFALMSAGVYFAIVTESGTVAFLTILTGYVEAQLLALSEELDNAWIDAISSQDMLDDIDGIKYEYKNKITNEHVRNELKDIAKKHKMTVNLLGQVEHLFRGAMAVEFGCATSGLIAELLGGLESTYLQLPYTLLQVAMDCFIGQRLLDASLVLENSVYSCKWENFDYSNQKTVYLMLMNSQKTLKLTVGGLTILSFACLMSVLKSIYSAYTALRSRI